MSLSTFNQIDFDLIDNEFDSLMKVASSRCRNQGEVQIVSKAFDFANQAHKNVRRRSGEPYIIHPIAVARIVVSEIGLGYKSIAAALLHDVVEDTAYTTEDIRTMFGDKIASLVDGLTKMKTMLDNEDRNNPGSAIAGTLQAENLKKILLTMNDDVRVVLIKLADRLHNCRTIGAMPEYKRDKILGETMFIFIPLAHRLGLYSIKTEMENIWLKYSEPSAYEDISTRIAEYQSRMTSQMNDFIDPMSDALKDAGFRFRIITRVKTPYSVWKKMQTKHIPFEEVYDIFAVRIIFFPDSEDPDKERQQAYVIFAIITGLYRYQRDRVRDWIKQPKNNGYEALHCTLMSKVGIWIEVQIRSHRMDDIAEKGIAAHWLYKEHGYVSDSDNEVDKWLAKVKDILMDNADNSSLELLDIIHSDLVTSDIVVYTPKGEQRTIQKGATVLDFAYQIHSRVGSKAIAAKVNRRLTPLSAVLRAGDQVEIITAENGQPKMEWLKFLQTRHAKSEVISYFKDRHDELSATGKEIFQDTVAKLGYKPSNDILRKFLDHEQLRDVGELYFRVALGLLDPGIFKDIIEGTVHSGAEYIISDGPTGKNRYVLADCCHPIPGDPVVGFKMLGGDIIVHKKTCPVAETYASTHGDRLVIPEWAVVAKEFPVRISLKGLDRVGLLNDITYQISRIMGINMRKLQLGSAQNIFEGYVELLVSSKDTVEQMIASLKQIDGIQEVVRVEL